MSTNSQEGILKLADFGISKILSDEMLTTNCGTPIYMAPEIWSGKAYDSKVDIWSMGVVMYYLLSGCHPFEGDLDVIGDHIIQEELNFDHVCWNLISSKGNQTFYTSNRHNPKNARKGSKQPSLSNITNKTHLVQPD
jgi:serine/threonine protein kinase